MLTKTKIGHRQERADIQRNSTQPDTELVNFTSGSQFHLFRAIWGAHDALCNYQGCVRPAPALARNPGQSTSLYFAYGILNVLLLRSSSGSTWSGSTLTLAAGLSPWNVYVAVPFASHASTGMRIRSFVPSA